MTHLSDRLNELNKNNFSTRHLAKLATDNGHPINHATVARYLNGKHPNPPRREALEALAMALGTDLANLERESGLPESRSPFELPAKAATLSDSERAAILHLIDVMVSSKQPQGMPGSFTYEYEKALQEKEREAIARQNSMDLEMIEHIGQQTPDGGEFRPDKYQNHRMLWERYRQEWRDHYILAAKTQEPGDDIDELYGYGD